MTLDELRAHWGLLLARELPDGSIAGVQPLFTTWSLVLGIDEDSWRYRFCYRGVDDALAALGSVRSERDVPDGPWVACRPEVRILDGDKHRYPTPAELRELRARAARGPG